MVCLKLKGYVTASSRGAVVGVPAACGGVCVCVVVVLGVVLGVCLGWRACKLRSVPSKR